MNKLPRWAVASALVLSGLAARAEYVNFESSHVHPIALTPDGTKLLVVNTPDALLEEFSIDASGQPIPFASIPVGLEPVTVVARTNTEAWVVNNLSDTVSIIDLGLGFTTRTLAVGDAPTDVVFAHGKAFVAVSREDAVKVYDLANLSAAPVVVRPFASRIRALAVSSDGNTVYAVAQDSGNQTTVVNGNIASSNQSNMNVPRLTALGLNDTTCSAPPPPYPPLPPGIVRNPALVDPPDGIPKVGLIVKWESSAAAWQDDAGQDWTACLPFRLPDHDLFAIDAVNPANAPVAVDHLGTTLFEVSVNPASGKIYIPNTEALNFVRFEPRVKGHVVDNRLTIVNPGAGNSATVVDLNVHIDRASNPATNLAERNASISQPGMMVWKTDGSIGYLTAIGSRKLFAVDGGCFDAACIFGPVHHLGRAAPDAVEVGEGPTGVALLEAKNRLYVLNRFSNSVAIVDAPSLTKVGELALHDPSASIVKAGRRFLYDGILSSGHGDAACSSCHVSGDKDGLGWDLGDPGERPAVPYTTANDNVRFIVPLEQPTPCDPAVCAAHQGFDPQKGPMTTQTLRAMLEPLHWRGDRATMNEFNPAFVGLLAAHDVGPVNGKPAGLSAADMEEFRQFTLAMRFPPNPIRRVDDSLSNQNVPLPGTSLTGNPAAGQLAFDQITDQNRSCRQCHASTFGTAGGTLGGVTPQEPTTVPGAAALANGSNSFSLHSDLKIPHLRNMVDKTGFVFGPAGGPYPDARVGFGFAHDGSQPNLLSFLSTTNFTIATTTNAQNIVAFLISFATGIRASVGQHVAVPQGAPPTGTPAQESLLATLITVGDLANANRHCELTATAFIAGRIHSYRLSAGNWLGDVAGQPAISTTTLRQSAQGPITFLCATLGSGVRVGGDRDEDSFLNGDDCAQADASSWAPPIHVTGMALQGQDPTFISWNDQAGAIGPGAHYDLVGGALSVLRASGLAAATSCIASDIAAAAFSDARPAPPMGDGYFYVIRAENGCGSGTFGPDHAVLDSLVCSP